MSPNTPYAPPGAGTIVLSEEYFKRVSCEVYQSSSGRHSSVQAAWCFGHALLQIIIDLL